MTRADSILAFLKQQGSYGATKTEAEKILGVDPSWAIYGLIRKGLAGKAFAKRNRKHIYLAAEFLTDRQKESWRRQDVFRRHRIYSKKNKLKKKKNPNKAPKRWKLEEIRQWMAEEGYTLLSTSFKSSRTTPVKFKCPKGHINTRSWTDFLTGTPFKHCRDCVRTDESEVAAFLQRFRYTLVSPYKNCRTPVEVLNPQGKLIKIEYASLKRHLLLVSRLRAMLKRVLKATGRKKTHRTHVMLGYNALELRRHIQSHPNWDRCKKGVWHIDHIFPVKAFLDHNITSPKIINALDNLQPLPGPENLTKNDKYDLWAFKSWLRRKWVEYKARGEL